MKTGKFIKLSITIILILLYPYIVKAQFVDHWEALILAENDWKYRVGDSEPPSSWFQPGFDDTSWLTGPGGIGYGDNDDATIIDSAYSVYLRKEFTIIDTSLISVLSLYADYDDAFVAYINGFEICRANIGTVGVPPEYDASTYEQREAKLYRGGLPEAFPTDKTLLHNGNNILAVQVHNNSIGSSDLSSLIFLLAGIIDNSHNYQSTPNWFPKPFTSSNVPIFVINTHGQTIISKPKITASLGVIDNGEGNINYLTDSYNNYDGEIGIEIRGSSSQDFPKKCYGFETRKTDGSNNNVSLLGLPPENDWVLYAPYCDKSLMRNVLAFHIGRQTGDYSPRTKWCELVMNGDYKGLYVLMEKIKRDSNRVDISKLKDTDTAGVELTGGYIFSVEREEEEKGWSSPYNNKPFYRYRYPDYDEIIPVQKNYLKDFITRFEELVDSSSSFDEYSQYIDIPSFVNYWIASEIFKNIDNYKFSFFMYKTKDNKGGKIHFGPHWDLNLAFGNFDFTQDPGPEGWSYVWASLPYLRPSWIYDISEEREIKNQINTRWKELRKNTLSTTNLLNFIDTQAAIIEDAQKRNFTRWPILGCYVYPNEFVGECYEDELNYLKTWLSNRLQWIDMNINAYCSLSSISQEDEPSIILPLKYKLYQNYPNPFNPKTSISYDIPTMAHVTIDILDLYGNKVTRIVFGYQEAGTYRFQFASDHLSSGIYFYRLIANEWTDTKKMIYMK